MSLDAPSCDISSSTPIQSWEEWQRSLAISLAHADGFTRAMLIPAAKADNPCDTMRILSKLSPRQIEALHPPVRHLVRRLHRRIVRVISERESALPPQAKKAHSQAVRITLSDAPAAAVPPPLASLLARAS